MFRVAGEDSVIRALARALLACLCLLVFSPAPFASGFQDAEDIQALSEWLTQAGLDELLAAVLEDQLRRAPAGTVSPAPLAEVYIRLLGKAPDERRIEDIRARSLVFLSRGPSPAIVRLGTALARADYRMALRDIDRLRMGDPDNSLRQRAAAALARASASLKGGGTPAGSGKNTGSATADAPDILSLTQETDFLKSWCRYWSLWLSRIPGPDKGAPGDAGRAEGLSLLSDWAGLLGTGKPNPEPRDLSSDLRNEEYYASSILGMALTKSLIEGPARAEEWFGLLREKGVWPGISSQLPDWYLQALVDAGQYDLAARFVGGDSGGLSPGDASGAAARAVIESNGTAEAIAFAQAVAAYAAAAGDLTAVKRLAGRIPALKEGDSFTAHLARGIVAYDDGRRPGEAARSRASLQIAATELAAASAKAPDVPKIAAAVHEWLAWSRMGMGDYCGASRAFESASRNRDGNRAEEMSWMAVRAALQGDCPGEDGVARGQSVLLARGYLKRFSDGAHSGDAEAILARAPEAETDALLAERLLGARTDADAPAGTREAAAILAYRRYRASAGQGRVEEAAKLLELAPSPPGDWPKDGIDLVVRLQIEASLDPLVARYEDARNRLERIRAVYPAGQEPVKLRTEMASRRLVLSIALSEAEAARQAVAVIRRSDESGTVRSAAERIFIAGIEPLVTGGKVPVSELEGVAEALLDARRFVLSETRNSGDGASAEAAELDLGSTLLSMERALTASVKGAEPKGQLRSKTAGMAGEALAIGRRLSARRPADLRVLSLVADAAVDAGDLRIAVEALSRLVNGLPARSDTWFSRKCDLCETLAGVDPGEARKVLEQHVILVPDWGPGDAGARLKALASKLGVKLPGREEERR